MESNGVLIMTGIYKFTNKQSGKVYVGQSVNIERRRQSHYWPSHAEQKSPLNNVQLIY